MNHILKDTLAALAIESWRLSKAFESLLIRSEAKEQRKYQSKLSWFKKKLDETLQEADLQLVNLENQSYDVGSAVKAINIDDFSSGDELIIDQMIEPIIMTDQGILKTGTVILRKASS